MKLPESLYFLRPGWWVVHVASVGAVFGAGLLVGHHLDGAGEHAHGDAPAHEGHQGEHDHASPDALRPLMQQMLVDSVLLQGALSEEDLPRAATHAAAIADACEDGDEAHGELPERLGPSFVERDRDLHETASRLAQALRAGQRDEARSLSQEMVSACQSCHGQAPAANEVDLRVLGTFAESLAAPEGSSPP